MCPDPFSGALRPASNPVPSPLPSYAALHRQSEADARRLAETLPESALTRRPSPGAWSAVECLAHLNAVAAACLPPLEAAVRDGAKRGRGPYTYGRMAGALRRALAPGSPPQRTNPSLDPSRDGSSDGFVRCGGLPGASARRSAPAIRPYVYGPRPRFAPSRTAASSGGRHAAATALRCARHSTADHAPGDGLRVSADSGSVSARRRASASDWRCRAA